MSTTARVPFGSFIAANSWGRISAPGPQVVNRIDRAKAQGEDGDRVRGDLEYCLGLPFVGVLAHENCHS